jgi:hypothetical protein
MRHGVFGAALAAAMSLASAPALAGGADFATQYRNCDGYGPALEDTDGISTHWTLWGMRADAGTNTSDKRTATGIQGVDDCDKVLADINPKHWLRKANLLRARALHELETDDSAGALPDLDKADAIVKGANDVFASRSLGLGIELTRAFAYHLAGDQAKAEGLAMAALAERPYNREVVIAARIAMGSNASPAGTDRVERALARLMPTAVDEVFQQALEDRRFAEAVALYPDLTPQQEIGELNISNGGYRERELRDFERTEAFWTIHGGEYAYALAALGKPAEARAALATARERVAKDAAPPPPVDTTLSKSDYAKEMAFRDELDAVHKRVALYCGKILDQWTWVLDARTATAEGGADEAWKIVQAHKLGATGNWLSLELLDSIAAHLPKKAAADVLAQRALLAKPSDKPDMKKEAAGATTLFKALPEAETADRVPDNKLQKSSFSTADHPHSEMDSEGYRVQPPDAAGAGRVAVFADKGTMSMVEELAMLHAAELARAAGKKGLIVTRREDVYHHLDTYYYSTKVGTQPAGFECDYDVVVVDPGALPEAYRSQAWRVIDADAAYAALAPVYLKAAKD